MLRHTTTDASLRDFGLGGKLYFLSPVFLSHGGKARICWQNWLLPYSAHILRSAAGFI